MNVKPVSSTVKAVALGLLIVYTGLISTAFAASSTPGSTLIQGADRAAAARTHSTSEGFELDYFHAYKASKTYAIRFKNGLRASFDFDKGTATLTDVAGNRTTLPLQQVLLQANNGNSQAAAEMYDQMYQSISAANSDAITASVGPEGAGTRVNPRPPSRGWGGIGAFGNDLWSTPTGGDCWPLPWGCHQWAGGLSNWGMYNNWWGSAFGDPPPTPQPPNPNGCAPNDYDCRLWEHDRRNACDDLFGDTLAATGSSALAGAACGSSGVSFGVTAVLCLASVTLTARSVHIRNKDLKQCHTPYPG